MKSIRTIEVTGKRVLVRVDYNLPMNDDGTIADDNRIRATLPLIDYLVGHRARIILMSHLGRPDGSPDPKYSLKPAADRLADLVGRPVAFAADCIGEEVRKKAAELNDGGLLLLENLRFHAAEKSNDDVFARELASLCDVYVNEAFSVSHRKQASVVAVTRFAPVSAAGFLLEKEIRNYEESIQKPVRPLAAVVGGAKVSGKLETLENMIRYVDTLIIGGAMANTFLKSAGIDTGGSMIEEDLVEMAAGILKAAEGRGVDVLLPVDLIVADAFKPDAATQVAKLGSVPVGWMALDIGPETAARYGEALRAAGTIVWNGPMGVFEMDAFMAGTRAVAEAIAGSKAYSVIGGGDTGLAVKRCGLADRMGYISTGGGAFLELMEGKELPGVTALR